MKKLLIAFSSGLLLGMLYAPAKGRKTRKKLAKLGNEVRGSWNDLTGKLAGKIDGMTDSIDTMAENAIERIESTQFETGERGV